MLLIFILTSHEVVISMDHLTRHLYSQFLVVNYVYSDDIGSTDNYSVVLINFILGSLNVGLLYILKNIATTILLQFFAWIVHFTLFA